MRTFHIGGAASRTASASSVETKSNGKIAFLASMRYVTNSKGERIAIRNNGELLIVDPVTERERERHRIPYGATVLVGDADEVKAGDKLATGPINSTYRV